MSKIVSALSKRPPDVMVLTSVLQEASQSSEQTQLAAIEILAYVSHVHQKLEHKLDTLINTPKVTTSVLSMFFNLNPDILEGFTVEEVFDAKKKDNVWKIFYNGSDSSAQITKAYNSVRKKLLNRFGLAEIDFKMLSEAIIQAHHWCGDSEEDMTTILLDTAVIEVACNMEKKFTISKLKEKLPSLNRKTKDIETLLLNNGWEYMQYQNSRVKYFFKSGDES